MSKLVCDFYDFEAIRQNILNMIEVYQDLLDNITSLSSDNSIFWQSNSQKAYYDKFMERKVELIKLSEFLNEMHSFLNDTLNQYINIEGRYS